MRRCWLLGLFWVIAGVAAPAVPMGRPCQRVETLPPLQIPEVDRYADLEETRQSTVQNQDFSVWREAAWQELVDFSEDHLEHFWTAWLQSCSALKDAEIWREVCNQSLQLQPISSVAIREFVLTRFKPYQLTNNTTQNSGTITGYYEPVLRGSRHYSNRFRYPIYARPADLIAINMQGTNYAGVERLRLRGRMINNEIRPYYSRREIDVKPSPLAGRELFWVEDIVDLFFLQIQGSGLIEQEDKTRVRVGYADQNGHQYVAIGNVLIKQGEMDPSQMSMQAIKKWGRNNPDKLRAVLNSNPSYVFFRELPLSKLGPPGSLGVPLTAERSLAVDTRYVPLGAPVFLSTNWPGSSKSLNRLMVAQDTGGAIKGSVRADFFWGSGLEAGRSAGAMKQQGRMWVLMPKEFQLK